MSNISSQLIKDSYNYVLQSDLFTGIVYRIGGDVPTNPKFISGLTINSSFTYSDGSEFDGYVLTCDASGNATWAPVSAATSGVFVTGGTFDYNAGTLQLRNSNGTEVTISGLEDVYVTGGTVSGTTVIFTYNDGNNFSITGITPYNLFSSYTASTQTIINNKLDVSGFTAYTASTQPLINNSITGGTYSNGTLNLINNSGGTVTITGFTTGGTSATDSYVTGFTLDNDIITLSQNRIDQYSAFNISLSGYVSNLVFTSYTANTEQIINSKVDDSIFNQFAQDTNIALNNKVEISTFNSYTATTQPLILNSITGGTYSNGTFNLINNSGGTVSITGFTTGGTSTTDTFVTGFTLSANTITLSQNRTDSYSSFTISLSAYTGSSVSGLTYYVSASTPNNVTLISGDRWFNTDTGVEVVWIDDGDSQQWIQPFSVPGPLSPDVGYYATTGITTGQTLTWDKTYWGISANTQVNLILPTTSSKDGYYLIIKDESGFCGNYRIRLTPSVGLIDGNNYVDMNINYMSLTCMVRNGNWYLI